MSLRPKYRFRTPSTGREIILEAGPGVEYVDRETGETHSLEHYVLQPPLFRAETLQVTLRWLIYASKADYDAGKDPSGSVVRVFETAVYADLMTRLKNVIEPAAIQRFLPAGTRVAD